MEMMNGGVVDPYPGLAVYATFTGADATAIADYTPEKAPVGAAWANDHGTFTIVSNQANCATIVSDAACYIESGKADGSVSVIVKTIQAGALPGLVLRYQDSNNYLYAALNNSGNNMYLLKKIAGTPSIVQTSGFFTVTDGLDYVMEAILSGSGIIIKVDGTERINTTLAQLATATKHGLYGSKANDKYDEFQVA